MTDEPKRARKRWTVETDPYYQEMFENEERMKVLMAQIKSSPEHPVMKALNTAWDEAKKAGLDEQAASCFFSDYFHG